MAPAARKPKRARLSLEPQPQAQAQAQAPPDQPSAAAGNSAFARALGSSDFHTREQGLTALAAWLATAGDALTPGDLDKVWKGVFYCFWHSDKGPVQVRACWPLNQLTQHRAAIGMTE